MQKITASSPEAKSTDLFASNIEKLNEMFPDLITESKEGVAVNLDVLKALVGDKTLSDADEKYGLNWHGKRRARQIALTTSTGTLRPCPEESVNWESTQNLMIEGDNLEVLKLLQKSYAGKVNLIYIDPPYNTGKDFVYPDNYQDNIKNYLELTGQLEEGQKISSNTEASGRFHTDWLNMMYPRLKLARNLLSNDGVILISIDDNEIDNLELALKEIFGEECVERYVWDVRERGQIPKTPKSTVRKEHEYLVAAWKTQSSVRFNRYLDQPYINNTTWTNSDSDPRGPWMSGNLSRSEEKLGTGNNFFTITTPAGNQWTRTWTVDPDEFNQLLSDGRIYFADEGRGVPRRKIFKNDVVEVTQSSIFQNLGSSQAGAEIVRALLNIDFPYPKPIDLIQRCISLTTEADKDQIILDFFAGSGTTAHAVMTQNVKDGGRRRYILVQLPEPLNPENKEQKSSSDFCDDINKPRTLAELTKERLRRSATKLKAEHNLFTGDTGFRNFKLDTSNIRAWIPEPENLGQTLLGNQDHLLEGRTEADVLYELLLKLGLDLCVPIEDRAIAGKSVSSVGGGVLMACLAEQIANNQVDALAQGIVDWHKELAPAGDTTCVFRDSAFADDVAKTNMAAILEQHGIQNVRSL